MIPSVPYEFYDYTSTVIESFKKMAISSGDSEDYAKELVRLLPQEIKETCVWHDKITNLWRYEFGSPYKDLPNNITVRGTNQFPPIKNLYVAMKNADKYLTREQLFEFINRLKDPDKHLDVLFEMRPVINISKKYRIKNEVTGLGIGNKRIDWYINTGLIRILFDVKYRIKSLIKHFEEIIPHIKAGIQSIQPSSPDPSDLFKSTEDKFIKRCGFRYLQGVWIKTEIKEDEIKLIYYFNNKLDRKKVHFAILSDWKMDAYILTRNILQKHLLKKIFKLTESKRHVSDEYIH